MNASTSSGLEGVRSAGAVTLAGADQGPATIAADTARTRNSYVRPGSAGVAALAGVPGIHQLDTGAGPLAGADEDGGLLGGGEAEQLPAQPGLLGGVRSRCLRGSAATPGHVAGGEFLDTLAKIANPPGAAA